MKGNTKIWFCKFNCKFIQTHLNLENLNSKCPNISKILLYFIAPTLPRRPSSKVILYFSSTWSPCRTTFAVHSLSGIIQYNISFTLTVLIFHCRNKLLAARSSSIHLSFSFSSSSFSPQDTELFVQHAGSVQTAEWFSL